MLKKIIHLIFLNLLWLIMCLPVITAGGSTCAAYAVALRLADEDEETETFKGIAKRFFKSFKQDFLQGIMIFLFTAACVSLGCYLSYLAYDSGLNLYNIAGLVCYFIIVIVLNLYSYPLIARYSNTFLNTVKNSIALFLQYPNQSVKTIGFVLIELAALYFTRYAFWCGVLFIPAIIFYTISRTAKDIFVQLENRLS